MRTLVTAVCVVAIAAWAGLAPAAEPDVKVLYERKGCADCHGVDGRTPRHAATPIIAGQNARYAYLVLKAYQTGERQGVGATQHNEVNELLSDEQIRLLSEYAATLK